MNNLITAKTLADRAACFFEIGATYCRMCRKDPAAWVLWMVYCRDCLLEDAKTSKVNHLLIKSNNAIACYALYEQKNVFAAMELAEKSLEYEALSVEDDHFVAMNLVHSYEILAECFDKLKCFDQTRWNYEKAKSILEVLSKTNQDINYGRRISELDERILATMRH